MNATCHFLIGLCCFICLGQLPIYSGIPLLPSTFLKFSFLTFLVQKSLRPQSPFVQIQVFSFFSSLCFHFSKKCLKLLFPRLAIVQKKLQTSTTTPPVIIVLITVVIRVVHGKGQLSGIFFFKCRMSQFNWFPVVSISFFEVNATCHFLIGLCRFICPGQLPIYSGIPPLPFSFLKFSFLTFLVQKSLRPQFHFVQIQVFSFFKSLGFHFSKKCLKFLFPRLSIVQKKLQTSTTTPPVIIVLITVVIVDNSQKISKLISHEC